MIPDSDAPAESDAQHSSVDILVLDDGGVLEVVESWNHTTKVLFNYIIVINERGAPKY